MADAKPSRVAKNIIQEYGEDKFKALIRMFKEDISGIHIAKEFKVSKQRIHQWKHTLGTRLVSFTPYPEVESLVGFASKSIKI